MGYRFERAELLELALTHRSAAAAHNERLEFLGDAVLGMLVADELFHRKPEAAEGELTRMRSHLVREESLAAIAREQGLEELVILGPGELRSGDWRRDSVMADALEAVLAAIYLDGGINAARDAILHIYKSRWSTLPDAQGLKDSKTRLQEWVQGREGWALPIYALIEESGPPHKRLFKVSGSLALPGGTETKVFFAQGRSRRRAEQDTAKQLLAFINKEFGENA